VVFEVYPDMPGMEWKDEVASNPDVGKAAWFKDSEGNIMCLDEAQASDRVRPPDRRRAQTTA
jgi:hypothetical protein